MDTAKDELNLHFSLYGRSFYAFLCCFCSQKGSAIEKALIESFVEVLRHSRREEMPLPLRLLRAVISRARTIPPADPEAFFRKPVLEALSMLDPDDRLLILLRDQQELLYQEIYKVLGWPEDKIKKRLHEARLHFRSKMETIVREKRVRTGHEM